LPSGGKNEDWRPGIIFVKPIPLLPQIFPERAKQKSIGYKPLAMILAMSPGARPAFVSLLSSSRRRLRTLEFSGLSAAGAGEVEHPLHSSM
jgi:hypothetical protein